MIWDYIRDFLVQYIFGGCDSTGEFYGGRVGYFIFDDTSVDIYDSMVPIGMKNSDLSSDLYISLGDWLSTTATIVIMCFAVVLACLLVRWVWRVVSSAMLLR